MASFGDPFMGHREDPWMGDWGDPWMGRFCAL